MLAENVGITAEMATEGFACREYGDSCGDGYSEDGGGCRDSCRGVGLKQ